MKKLFSELEIKEETKKAIEDLGFIEMTEIQRESIPYMILGKDFIAQSQTGSGKTFAYAIPIIEKIERNKKQVQSIILCPTRELALQVNLEFKKLLKYNDRINTAVIVGGESYDKQFRELKNNPYIVIGTPGRVIDHLNRGTLSIDSIMNLTFDEADEMLKMGFEDDIKRILESINSDHQTVLFSATIPKEIKEIAKQYQKESTTIKVSNKNITVETIEQKYFVVKKQDKLKLVKRLVDFEDTDSIIIFSNTKKVADEITEELNNYGYNASSLHGDLKQAQRNSVIQSFRNSKLNILVATDVAARGLDIENVGLVINFDLPHENEVYVHRIGRTGRAGKSGKAYSIITPRTTKSITNLEHFINQKIKRQDVPSVKEIEEKNMKLFIDNILDSSIEKSSRGKIKKTFNELTERGIDKDLLIELLLNKLVSSNKKYEEIETVAVNDKNKVILGSSNKQTIKIDLGKNDRLTPKYLLELLDGTFTIKSKNIGGIKIYKNYTELEINPKVLGYVKMDKVYKYQKSSFKISKK